MPSFNWVGKTRDGLIKKGVIVADDSEAAMAALRAQAIMPTSVKPKPNLATTSRPLNFACPKGKSLTRPPPARLR